MTFVDSLLSKHAAKVEKSTTHPLTNELCQGTLPDYKLFTYLVQDLKYFQLGLRLMGNTLARCDNPDSAVVIAKQIGFVANDENTYFHQCLHQLKTESGSELKQHVPEMLDSDRPILKSVLDYLAELSYMALESDSYAEIITFVYVMEKVYLGWAEHNLNKENSISELSFKHKEWVDLHSGPDFTRWVEFLASEVNRVSVSDKLREIVEFWFEKTLDLEIAFFDSCYSYGE